MYILYFTHLPHFLSLSLDAFSFVFEEEKVIIQMKSTNTNRRPIKKSLSLALCVCKCVNLFTVLFSFLCFFLVLSTLLFLPCATLLSMILSSSNIKSQSTKLVVGE